MTDGRPDLLQGTLELLVPNTLALGPIHGWRIAQRASAAVNRVLDWQGGAA